MSGVCRVKYILSTSIMLHFNPICSTLLEHKERLPVRSSSQNTHGIGVMIRMSERLRAELVLSGTLA